MQPQNQKQTQTKTPQTTSQWQYGVPKTQGSNPALESQKWSTRYDIAKSHQLPLFKKWSKWYDDMYAHVHNQQMAPWRSRVYMPIIASKVWDLISRFIQYRPGWDVSVRTLPINTLSKEAFDAYMSEMNKRVEKVTMKLDYDFDNPLMDDPIQDELLAVMLDAAVTGQGLGRVPWLNKQTEYKNYVAKGDTLDFSQVVNKMATEGYNAFTAVNIFNFFLAPAAESLQKSPWIIVHDFVPLYKIKQDPKYDQSKVALLKTNGVTNEFAQYQQSRNRFLQSQDNIVLDTTTATAEIFECYDNETNECIIYGLGQGTGTNWVELYRGQNVYWHKKYPLVPFYIRRKPYQFWGESLFENSETLQSAVNDIFNHYMDNHNMADGMIAIEEGSVVSPYIVEPGGELRYRGEMPKQFKFPQPDAAGMQTAMNLVTGSIENATISQYASGIPNSSTDNTQGTATGVTRMMEAAAEKVGFMRSNFRRSWREVGQMWLSNTQQFMRTNVVYEKKSNGQTTHEVIKPSDMVGIYNLKIDDGSFEPISKDEKRKNYLDYVANLQGWQESSIAQAERTQDYRDALRLDWNQIMQRGSEHFGENPGHFTLPSIPPAEAPQAPAEAPTQPAPAGEPQPQPEGMVPMSPEDLGMV